MVMVLYWQRQKKAAKSVLQAFISHNEDGTNILQEFVKESAGEDIRLGCWR